MVGLSSRLPHAFFNHFCEVFKLTRIECIKYLIFNNEEPNLTDTAIQNLIDKLGFNGSIRFIATAQYNKISQELSSIDDGANKITFQNKLNGLEKLIKTATEYGFDDPEGQEGVNQLPKNTTLSLDTESTDTYWSSSR